MGVWPECMAVDCVGPVPVEPGIGPLGPEMQMESAIKWAQEIDLRSYGKATSAFPAPCRHSSFKSSILLLNYLPYIQHTSTLSPWIFLENLDQQLLHRLFYFSCELCSQSYLPLEHKVLIKDAVWIAYLGKFCP